MRTLILTLAIMMSIPMTVLASWENDEVGTRYKNEDGSYKTGWHQDVDGKWYYLDDNTGYVLKDTTTPDGFTVSNTGEWVVNIDSEDNKNYNNKADLVVKGISASSDRVLLFGYDVPVSVYYNTTYKSNGGELTILSVELSKDGALFATVSAQDMEVGIYGLNQSIKYTLEDGTVIQKEKLMQNFAQDTNFETNFALLSDPSLYDEFKNNKVVSAEIALTEITD